MCGCSGLLGAGASSDPAFSGLWASEENGQRCIQELKHDDTLISTGSGTWVLCGMELEGALLCCELNSKVIL